MKKAFDILILGAGPAGSATALSLAAKGSTVGLIEQANFTSFRIGETLSPEIKPFLQDLSAWEDFISLKSIPSFGIQSIWGNETPNEYTYVSSPYGNGWHVDRLDFDMMLANQAKKAGVAVFTDTKMLSFSYSNGHWKIGLHSYPSVSVKKDIVEMQAKIIIDATGRQACLSKWTSTKSHFVDHLVGISIRTPLKVSELGYLLIEAFPLGWCYSCPTPDNNLLTTLMTDADICKKHNLGTNDLIISQIPSSSCRRLSTYKLMSPPKIFNAVSRRCVRNDYSMPWLAVGDAAMSTDPLAGKGIISAFASAKVCSEAAYYLLCRSDSKLVIEYDDYLDGLFTQYLKERSEVYSSEKRWPDQLFWKRRLS